MTIPRKDTQASLMVLVEGRQILIAMETRTGQTFAARFDTDKAREVARCILDNADDIDANQHLSNQAWEDKLNAEKIQVLDFFHKNSNGPFSVK